MPQPKLAGSELIERINALVGTDKLNRFVLNPIKSDAELLMKSDAYRAFIALGTIAGLEHDYNLICKYFNKALKHHNDCYTNLSYGSALNNYGVISEAAHYYEIAYKLAPDSIEVVNINIRALIHSGNFYKANGMLRKWEKLNPGKTHVSKKLIEDIVIFMDANELSDDETSLVTELADKFLLDNGGYRCDGTALDLLDEDGQKWISYVIRAKKSVKEIVDLNCNFAEYVTTKLPAKILNSFIVRFGSVPSSSFGN